MKFRRFLWGTVVMTSCLVSMAACGPAMPPIQTGQHAYTSGQGRSRVNYLLFLPQEYGQEPEKKWPLMVFLHGIAKRGDSLEELDVLKVDGPPMIVESEPDYPFIVLSPQCPSNSYWETEFDKLDALVDEIADRYAVDPKRIYLTGLSMGGFGAWHYALRHPERFAAVVPIAGGHKPGSDEVPESICALQDVPIWVFHGAKDGVVSARQSQVLVEALEACPGNVRFTLYLEADHDDSWKLAYSDPKLTQWFLEQSRP